MHMHIPSPISEVSARESVLRTELPAPLLYDRPQAAARLAIAIRTLDEQVALGNIRHVKIGRSVRFRESALIEFIEANESNLSAKRRAAMSGRK